MVESIINNPQGIIIINALDSNNESPAHIAASANKFEILKRLVDKGAFMDQPNAAKNNVIEVISKDENRFLFIESLRGLQISDRNQKCVREYLQEYYEKRNKSSDDNVKNASLLSPALKRISKNFDSSNASNMNILQNIGDKIGVQAFEAAVSGNLQSIIKNDSMASQSRMDGMSRFAGPSPQKIDDSDIEQHKEILKSLTAQIRSNLQFELPQDPEEKPQSEQLVVSCLMVGKGMFYLPKTVEFDHAGEDQVIKEHPQQDVRRSMQPVNMSHDQIVDSNNPYLNFYDQSPPEINRDIQMDSMSNFDAMFA